MKKFDFEQIGKRMQYNVPYGFFDKFEEDIMEKAFATPSQREEVNLEHSTTSQQPHIIRQPFLSKGWRRLLWAVAAAVALFLVVKPLLPKNNTGDFESVEMAFNNLSTDDQDFLIQVYEEDDLFMNP